MIDSRAGELERLRRLGAALEPPLALPAHEDWEVISRLGRRLLRCGLLTAGVRAHELAEASPAPADLIACGDVCLSHGMVERALRAYRQANAHPDPGKLLDCERSCLASGRIDDALLARSAS